MSYCTRATLAERAGGERQLQVLLDQDGDGQEDPGVEEGARRGAQGEIHGYLRANQDLRARLPLPGGDPILSEIEADIAIYRLATGPQATDERRKRYEDAIRKCREIRDNNLKLALPEPERAVEAHAESWSRGNRWHGSRP